MDQHRQRRHLDGSGGVWGKKLVFTRIVCEWNQSCGCCIPRRYMDEHRRRCNLDGSDGVWSEGLVRNRIL